MLNQYILRGFPTTPTQLMIDYAHIYKQHADQTKKDRASMPLSHDPRTQHLNALQAFLYRQDFVARDVHTPANMDGLSRMQACVRALNVLDTAGWKRR